MIMGMLAVNGMLGKVLGGIVGNLFIIFFQNPMGQFCVVFWRDSQPLGPGIKGYKGLQIFKEIFRFFRVTLFPESTQKKHF